MTIRPRTVSPRAGGWCEFTTIRFNCPGCGSRLSVPEASAGIQGPCPVCGQFLVSPHRSQAPLGPKRPFAARHTIEPPVARGTPAAPGSPGPPGPEPAAEEPRAQAVSPFGDVVNPLARSSGRSEPTTPQPQEAPPIRRRRKGRKTRKKLTHWGKIQGGLIVLGFLGSVSIFLYLRSHNYTLPWQLPENSWLARQFLGRSNKKGGSSSGLPTGLRSQ